MLAFYDSLAQALDAQAIALDCPSHYRVMVFAEYCTLENPSDSGTFAKSSWDEHTLSYACTLYQVTASQTWCSRSLQVVM